jgi:molybdate-binding protein/DNA-binding HxlR family transcriptional regulator
MIRTICTLRIGGENSMNVIQQIHSENALKLFGDPVRLSILRYLIYQPATLSQLGEKLNIHPSQVRNHIKQLEKEGLVELVSIRRVKNFLEKYYQATASAFFINMMIVSQKENREQLVILGGDDPALDILTQDLNQNSDPLYLTVVPVGGLNGLIFLRDRICQMAGCNCLDMNSGEYNLPYVRLLFTDRRMAMVTLAHRQQGLLVKKGNPLQINNVNDFTRSDLKIINPKSGTGPRMWLDQYFQKNGIDAKSVNGYEFGNEVTTYATFASTIASGAADVGLGLYPLAQRFGLDFIPLFEERYDLVMEDSLLQSPQLSPVLEEINSQAYREKIESLGGYNTSQTGKIIRVS